MDLIVGDPHLQVGRIEDARKFIEKLTELSKTHGRIIVLGDLFHSFALIRSEVLALWAQFVRDSFCQVIMLVGNHDYAGQEGGTHALEAFKDQEDDGIRVMDKPTRIGTHWFLPFYRDTKAFEEECRKIPAGSILFCHQSFIGVTFGHGVYDSHSADPNCVAHLEQVISGHIHSTQKVFNVWYPGSPFQHSFGEAGDEKFIYSVEYRAEGGYDVVARHDLQMPRYIEIQADTVLGLLERLPAPNPQDSYKFVARGSPQEIVAFRQDERFKQFRLGARRVVDALVPERGQVVLPGQDGTTKTEKCEAYIRSRKWRTPTAQLLASARELLAN